MVGDRRERRESVGGRRGGRNYSGHRGHAENRTDSRGILDRLSTIYNWVYELHGGA